MLTRTIEPNGDNNWKCNKTYKSLFYLMKETPQKLFPFDERMKITTKAKSNLLLKILTRSGSGRDKNENIEQE